MKQKLVLVGGGHSHAIALKLWQQSPLPDAAITLISNVRFTPYSGMLPGQIAGYYDHHETHIDLPQLAAFAGVDFIQDEVIGLDPDRKTLFCRQSEPIPFDYLSLNLGSTPIMDDIPGASQQAIAAKPVPHFLDWWHHFLQDYPQQQHPISIAIVGGGAGGVELAFTINCRLKQLSSGPGYHLDLFQRNPQLLPNHNAMVRAIVERNLQRQGIFVHRGQGIAQVTPHQLLTADGQAWQYDHLIWVTNAGAPPWLKEAGLSTDDRGFVLVTNTLQSCSHPFILAAGDIATMVDHPRPKAGVFAVRQGRPLFVNWQRLLQGQPLQPYRPQTNYLGLIGTGDGSAIASWGQLGYRSRWLWQWKDRIDRRFMAQFVPRGNSPSIPSRSIPDL